MFMTVHFSLNTIFFFPMITQLQTGSRPCYIKIRDETK